jgi:hypothetical protein
MNSPIRPALSPTEWHRRQCGAVSVHVVNDETHVALRDPDGEVVSVSGDDDLFAMMALANCAMSDEDPRKLCRKDLAVLSVLIDEYRLHGADRQIMSIAHNLYEKLAALLPGGGRTTPESGTAGSQHDY